MHVMFSYRKTFFIAVTLFWLVTMGMLLQRHYGTFHLSGIFQARAFRVPSLLRIFLKSSGWGCILMVKR